MNKSIKNIAPLINRARKELEKYEDKMENVSKDSVEYENLCILCGIQSALEYVLENVEGENK